MRTLLTILMAAMMMLLTACGGGNAQTGADTSAQKEPQTTSSARSDQRVLVAYFLALTKTQAVLATSRRETQRFLQR